MTENSGNPPHRSVLYQEIIDGLSPQPGGFFIDATVGAGGHAWGILSASKPNGKLLGLDLDPQALDLASQRLSIFADRVTLKRASYRLMDAEVANLGWTGVDGIVMDLGLSSMQLDDPERGFSFRYSGPLDMRFGDQIEINAADLINTSSEKDIAEILWKYGEERYSRRIARAIVEARPLRTTTELAELVKKAYPKKSGDIHPATRTFQAIRIAVNQELKSVEESLPIAISLLNPGGRLAVISFHSLEDRIVKQTFQRESRDCICPPEQLVCTCGHRSTIKLVNRKPILPTQQEIENNTRSRSAKLRIIEKI